MTLTATDQFCGAGGSSIGATLTGKIRLDLGLNHNRLAIDTHQTNFPDAAHDCADISQTDPRRYRRTDILLTSPECTNHSGAKGVSRKTTAPNLIDPGDPAAERSRATMWDVVRFAEHHRYDAIVVENVVEVRSWELFGAWWSAMASLGYDGQSLSLNSMHAYTGDRVPQSRDRVYMVFWRRGATRPDLRFTPPAWCPSCEAWVEAVQVFKRAETMVGRFRAQYTYRCPTCTGEASVPVAPAAKAIDWTLPAPRIGDRKRPLAKATVARIERGLARYCVPRRPFIAELRGGGSDARPVDDPAATVTASGNHHGLVCPPLVMRNNGGVDKAGPMCTPIGEPQRTVTTAGHQSLVVPPALVGANRTNNEPKPADINAAPTVVTSGSVYLVMPYYGQGNAKPTYMPLDTQPTRDRFAIVVPTDYGVSGGAKRARPATEPKAAQTTRQTDGLLVPPGGTWNTEPVPTAAPAPTQTATEAWGVIPDAVPEVDDCGFRMLQPHEIGAAMAFPDDYVVLGNKRDQVAQYGNAVTPPVLQMILERVVGALEGS